MKTCPKCNTKANDDAIFCSGCGFHFDSSESQVNANEKPGRIKLILVILITVFIILSMAVGGFIWWNQPAKRVQRLLDLGQKYLAELDYDQSIIALERALTIDPKNALLYSNLAEVYIVKAEHCTSEEEKLSLYESANENYENALYYAEDNDELLNDDINEFYLKWAQIYIDRNDYEMAKRILKQGYDITEQETLEAKLDEIEKQETSDAKPGETEKQEADLPLYNQNARALIISILQVYQPKSYDKVSDSSSYHADCSYTYDESGKLPVMVNYNFDGSDFDGEISFRYGADGLPNYMECHEDGSDYSNDYFYDDNGQLINSTWHNLHEPQDPINNTYRYSENGVLQGRSGYADTNASYKYEYDEKNRIITEYKEDEYGKTTTSYEYDELNRIVKMEESTVYGPQNQYTSVTTYNY